MVGPPLKITLVAGPSELAPEDTETLAQFSSDGTEDALSETPPVQPDQVVQTASLDNPAGDPEILDAQGSTQIPVSGENGAQENNLNRAELTEQINLAYLNSQAQPREKYVSARSRESQYAAYIEKWRLLVERVGNLNYPEAAKQQKIEGSLVLDVAILADGTVQKVRILSSSGHKILDDAAARIVHIAAPYDRFPDEIRQELDVLHIVRTWEFGQDRMVSRAVTENL